MKAIFTSNYTGIFSDIYPRRTQEGRPRERLVTSVTPLASEVVHSTHRSFLMKNVEEELGEISDFYLRPVVARLVIWPLLLLLLVCRRNRDCENQLLFVNTFLVPILRYGKTEGIIPIIDTRLLSFLPVIRKGHRWLEFQSTVARKQYRWIVTDVQKPSGAH
jgi:hypothetical protein